jgi:hypothetical protein
VILDLAQDAALAQRADAQVVAQLTEILLDGHVC